MSDFSDVLRLAIVTLVVIDPISATIGARDLATDRPTARSVGHRPRGECDRVRRARRRRAGRRSVARRAAHLGTRGRARGRTRGARARARPLVAGPGRTPASGRPRPRRAPRPLPVRHPARGRSGRSRGDDRLGRDRGCRRDRRRRRAGHGGRRGRGHGLAIATEWSHGAASWAPSPPSRWRSSRSTSYGTASSDPDPLPAPLGCEHGRMRLLRGVCTVALALAAVCVAASPAAAHGVGGREPTNVRSRIVSVSPQVAGLTVTLIEDGERVEVTNRGPTEVAVLGYGTGPISRRTRRVFENTRSPAVSRTARSTQPATYPARTTRRPNRSGAASVLTITCAGTTTARTG